MLVRLKSNTNTFTHGLIIVLFLVIIFVAWQFQLTGLSARKPRCKSFLLLHTLSITLIALLATNSYTINNAWRCDFVKIVLAVCHVLIVWCAILVSRVIYVFIGSNCLYILVF